MATGKPKSSFISMNVTPEGRDAIQRVAALLGGQVAARVPYSPALVAALQVAERHLDEVAAQYLANIQDATTQEEDQ